VPLAEATAGTGARSVASAWTQGSRSTQAAVPDPWKSRLDLAEHLSDTTPVR